MDKIPKFNFITADYHSVVNHGMTFILKDLYKGAVVYNVKNFTEIIKVLNQVPIDLLILDIIFSNSSSLNIISTLKKIQPKLKILVFTSYDEDIYAIRYINAGANGYLNKLSSVEEIKLAINSVVTIGKYTSQNIQNKIVSHYISKKPINPFEKLSNREIEVAKFLVDGFSNNNISLFLNVQKTTVSTYKSRVFEKLSVDTLSELIQAYNLYYTSN